MKRDDLPFQRHWLYYTVYRLTSGGNGIRNTWHAERFSACGRIILQLR